MNWWCRPTCWPGMGTNWGWKEWPFAKSLTVMSGLTTCGSLRVWELEKGAGKWEVWNVENSGVVVVAASKAESTSVVGGAVAIVSSQPHVCLSSFWRKSTLQPVSRLIFWKICNTSSCSLRLVRHSAAIASDLKATLATPLPDVITHVSFAYFPGCDNSARLTDLSHGQWYHRFDVHVAWPSHSSRQSCVAWLGSSLLAGPSPCGKTYVQQWCTVLLTCTILQVSSCIEILGPTRCLPNFWKRWFVSGLVRI